MNVLLLCRQDLETVLDIPSVIKVLEDAFHDDRIRQWDTPRRIAAHTKNGGLLAMPCGGGTPAALGAKLVSTFAGNRALGLPSVSGLYVLFDPKNGAPLSVMDGGYLTLIRTAAVSALATRVMARINARTLGVLGAGPQAEWHVRLLVTVRPIDTVKVWARNQESARALIAALKTQNALRQVTSWIVCVTAREAAACDVVVTATGATAAVVEGGWLSSGSHLNCIGAHTKSSREIDGVAVRRASVLAVETGDTLLEAGDFQMAEAEEKGVVERVVTLGSLIDPERTAKPRDPRAITIFKSCGVAFEDLAVAALAHRRAQEKGLGPRFRFA
jgi:alanine dehydrogenase